MENLKIALLLMVVGMATVFTILLIVIYLGKGLICLGKKYAPEEVTEKKQRPEAARSANKNGISEQETAVIVSAISMVTHGLGKVIKIEKV